MGCSITRITCMLSVVRSCYGVLFHCHIDSAVRCGAVFRSYFLPCVHLTDECHAMPMVTATKLTCLPRVRPPLPLVLRCTLLSHKCASHLRVWRCLSAQHPEDRKHRKHQTDCQTGKQIDCGLAGVPPNVCCNAWHATINCIPHCTPSGHQDSAHRVTPRKREVLPAPRWDAWRLTVVRGALSWILRPVPLPLPLPAAAALRRAAGVVGMGVGARAEAAGQVGPFLPDAVSPAARGMATAAAAAANAASSTVVLAV